MFLKKNTIQSYAPLLPDVFAAGFAAKQSLSVFNLPTQRHNIFQGSIFILASFFLQE
jgi:hypothetical protein